MNSQQSYRINNSKKKHYINVSDINNIEEKIKMISNEEDNDSTETKKYEYFPIASEKSKNGGHTIYLVTNGDEINNENIKGNDKDYSNIEKKPIEKRNIKNLIEQRSIEFKIYDNKFGNLLNGSRNLRKNNSSETLNINNYNKLNNININNIKIINKDFSLKDGNIKILKIHPGDKYFNPLKLNQIKKQKKFIKSFDSNTINIRNRNKAYKKKINIKQNSFHKKDNKNKVKNNLSELKIDNNDIIIEKNSITEPNFEQSIEIKKNNFSNNNSLLDSLSKNINNFSILNNSYEVKDTINSLYNSLNFVKNNLNDDLNNSKIMENNFLSGIKNEDRKNSLKKAIFIYNRLKTYDTHQKFNYNLSLTSKLYKEIKEKDENISFNNNNNILENNNIEEDENENEFSFNSNLKKTNLENNLSKNNNIIEKNNNNIEQNIINGKEDKNDNINNIVDENIRDINNIVDHDIIQNEDCVNIKDNDNNSDYIDINQKDKDNNKNNSDFIDINNKNNIDDIDINNENIKDNYNNENNNDYIDKNNDKNNSHDIENNDDNNINKNNIETNYGINNIVSFNKELNNFEKIINKENIIKEDISKEDNSLNENSDEINEDNKSIKLNNKTFEIDDSSKQPYFIRKVIREEHYYIDENGEEKLLEVKQKYINNEDDQPKFNSPYIRKNISMKNSLNLSKIKENNNDYQNNNNIINNDKEEYKTVNNKKNIQNQTYDVNLENMSIKEILEEEENKQSESKENDANVSELSDSKKEKLDKKVNFSLDFESYLLNNMYNIKSEKKKKNTYNFIKNNHTYQKSPNPSKENVDFFGLKKNKSNLVKNIFNIKKEKPVVLKSSNLENITSRVSRPFQTLIINSSKTKEDTISSNHNTINNNISTNKYKDNNYSNITKYKNHFSKLDKAICLKKTGPKSNFMTNNDKNKHQNKDLNKNHVFHEIKISKNKNKNKLTSNSQSNYFSKELSLDELNVSNLTYRNPVNIEQNKEQNKEENKEQNKEQKNRFDNQKSNIQKYFSLDTSMFKQKNFSNKSNSESYFTINMRNINKNNNSNEKAHHKYYESKSIKNNKKIVENESGAYTGRHKENLSDLNKDNLNNSSNKDKNKLKDQYFYQKMGL